MVTKVGYKRRAYQARCFSLTRIWMGERSYVNLAAGMSVVSYVWLCTCVEVPVHVGRSVLQFEVEAPRLLMPGFVLGRRVGAISCRSTLRNFMLL